MSYNPVLSKEAGNTTKSKNYPLCLICAVQWQENKQIRNLDENSLDGTIGEVQIKPLSLKFQLNKTKIKVYKKYFLKQHKLGPNDKVVDHFMIISPVKSETCTIQLHKSTHYFLLKYPLSSFLHHWMFILHNCF